MKTKSLISLRDEEIENVRSFKCLGHVLSNVNCNSPAFINHQIASAYSKWNELKTVLLDRRIFLSTRVKLLEACVWSWLIYSVQAWQKIQKLESIWCGFLRRMVKGGFALKNARLPTIFLPKKLSKYRLKIPKDIVLGNPKKS